MSDPTEPRSDHDSEEATTNCLWDEYVMACADRDALKEVLSEVLKDVKPLTTAEERKAAWVYKVIGDWEFHGPNEFYWYGGADNAFDARAKGWQAWMRSKEVQS